MASAPEYAELYRRTAGQPLKRLRDLTRVKYKAHEVAREDHYINPYQRRIYSYGNMEYKGKHSALEVLPMAFEDVQGNSPARLQRMVTYDRGMFDLVMGLLHHYVPS